MDNSNNNVDISSQMGYNVDTNDDSMIVVKMDEQKAIHDTACMHDQLQPDYDDTIGGAIYHGCLNPQCGVGFYINK